MTSTDLDAVFAHKVGDFVFIRAEAQRWNEVMVPALEKEPKSYIALGELSALSSKPGRLCIIGRHVEECHGGLQLYYSVRVGDKVYHFFEFELSATLETQ